MVTDRRQLLPSLRISCGLMVATLAIGPGINSLLAGGDDAVVAYQHPQLYGSAGYGDGSCEPTFRGGNCEDCCLPLWTNYCEQRTCCHAHARRHFGGGCLFGLGCFFGGHFSGTVVQDGPAGECSCQSNVPVTPSHPNQVPLPLEYNGTRGDQISSPAHTVVPKDEPTEVQPYQSQPIAPPAVESEGETSDLTPPENPLPPEPPALQEDAARDLRSNRSVPPSPPSPPRIDFSVEPAGSSRLPLTTVSGKGRQGTVRLLQQLRSQ